MSQVYKGKHLDKMGFMSTFTDVSRSSDWIKTVISPRDQLSEWGDWSECNAFCDGGTRNRTRVCDKSVSSHVSCDSAKLYEVEACGTRDCASLFGRSVRPTRSKCFHNFKKEAKLVTARIIGGEKASLTDWPFIGLFYRLHEGTIFHFGLVLDPIK